MTDQMLEFKKFAFKLFIFLIPFFGISATYVLWDPFQVIYPREYFYQNCHVEPNRDYVSTEVFLKNVKKISFDSFILGSSRSMAFRCSEWMKYEKNAEVYHYDAANESLYGVWLKVKYLDSRGMPLRNALWIMDRELLRKTDEDKGHLFLKHPSLSGVSWARFHLIMFAAYFERLFFVKYIDYHFFHTYRRYMGDVISQKVIKFDPVRNDKVSAPKGESDVKPYRYYYQKYKNIFYSRNGDSRSNAPAIREKQLALLQEIADIFKKHQTCYKIVINPLYDQIKFNSQDLALMQKIFGKENIYDFSGVNRFTDDIHHYIETSHYKRKVAEEILKTIYQNTRSHPTNSRKFR